MFLWNTLYSTDFVNTPVTEYKETAPTPSSRYETVKLYRVSPGTTFKLQSLSLNLSLTSSWKCYRWARENGHRQADFQLPQHLDLSTRTRTLYMYCIRPKRLYTGDPRIVVCSALPADNTVLLWSVTVRFNYLLQVISFTY